MENGEQRGLTSSTCCTPKMRLPVTGGLQLVLMENIILKGFGTCAIAAPHNHHAQCRCRNTLLVCNSLLTPGRFQRQLMHQEQPGSALEQPQHRSQWRYSVKLYGTDQGGTSRGASAILRGPGTEEGFRSDTAGTGQSCVCTRRVRAPALLWSSQGTRGPTEPTSKPTLRLLLDQTNN